MSDQESTSSSDDDEIQQTTIDEYSTFQKTVLVGSVHEIKTMIKNGANLAEKTKDGYNIVELVCQRPNKNEMIKQLLICEYEKMKYLRNLLKLDKEIIDEMSDIFDQIMILYKDKTFLHKTTSESLYHKKFYDDYVKTPKTDGAVRESEYALIMHFRHISQCIGILNRHEGSIMSHYKNLINWYLLQGVEEALCSHPLWNTDPGKLFESISSNCFLLQKFFNRIKNKLDEFDMENDDIKILIFEVKECKLLALYEYVMPIYDKHFAECSLDIIDTVEKLTNLNEKNEKLVMFHCIQLLGEISHSFSGSIFERLRTFNLHRLKAFRDEIKNHWENTIRAIYLLENIETNIYDEDLKNIRSILIKFYKPLLNGIILKQDLSTVLQEESKTQIYRITSSFKKRLETKPTDTTDPNSTDIKYVIKQINLLLKSIGYTRAILDECKKNQPDEHSIRSQLKLPKIHYRCLLFLTIIGSTVQNMRTKHAFLATVPVGLHEKLDYLRWIRNTLMHYDIHFRSNFYRNTLFDYLSNDLLIEEYSIDLHGQLMLQYEQFLKKLESELKNYCTILANLSYDNYYTTYSGVDKHFYQNDVKRKRRKVNDFLFKSKQKLDLLSRITSELQLMEFMKNTHSIKCFCDNSRFRIVGIFGPLAKCGSTQNNSPSGVLVKAIDTNYDSSFYDNLSKLKQHIVNDCSLKNICVVEVEQMREYIIYKQGPNTDITFLVEEISKYSLERLSNGKNFYHEIKQCIETRNINDASKQIINELLVKEQRICYEYRDQFRDDPILHELCSVIIYKRIYPTHIRIYFKSIIERILDDGAEINVQTYNVCTILHSIANDSDNGRRSLRSFIPEKHKTRLKSDIVSRWHECIPLNMAILYSICPLKYELGQLTDLYQHANELIIAAIKVRDLEFLMYMLHVVRDDKGQYLTLTGRYREDGHSLFFELLECEAKSRNRELDRSIVILFKENENTYIDLIEFLLENNVELRLANGSFQDYEKLLMHLLLHKFNELVLTLLHRETHVDFFDSQGNYPIHVALQNIIDCKIQSERESYLEVLTQIIQHSINLNFELHWGRDVPLYIAAKHGELDIVKLLLEQKQKVNINYKPHRYSHHMCRNAPKNEYEIIILLLENGLPTEITETVDYIENDKLRSYLGRCNKLFLDYVNRMNGTRTELFRILQEEPDLRRLLVNRRNECGKNLLYYAIRRSDAEFIKLILTYECSSVNLAKNHTVNSKRPGDSELYKYYIDYLVLYATGEIMIPFIKHGCIDWKNWSDINMEQITSLAIKKNDQVLFQLIEQYGYPIISYQFMKYSLVKSYAHVFRNLESPANLDNRRSIKQLPNPQVLFQNKHKSNYSTSLSIAVRRSKLSIVKYLIEDLKYDIHAISYSSNYNDKISALDDFIISGNENLKMLQYLMDKHVRILDIRNFNLIARLSDTIRSHFRVYIDSNEEIRELIFESITKHHLHDLNIVQFLLSLTTWDPNRFGDFGYTALHHCADKSYNDTIRLLCDSKRVDVELLTQNVIYYFTTGNRTPVGVALEGKNFEGARLLVEKYNASPYKYLLVLLIDALGKHDEVYVKLLLQKSVITDFEQTTFFLRDYANGNLTELDNIITLPVLERAVIYAKENKLLQIPDFILDEINKCCDLRRNQLLDRDGQVRNFSSTSTSSI